jgi:hypothetical protein
MHPEIRPGSQLLERRSPQGDGFSVRLTGEGGKLNLNFILAGEDPKKLEVFTRYLESFGLDFDQRQTLVDCLLDWIDPDDEKHLNGREASDGYQPPNRPLLNLDEIADVHGAAPLVEKPGWRENLTLLSQGPVDLASAKPEVLALLPWVNLPAATRFAQLRDGRDEINGTRDDAELKGGVPEALSFLGLQGQRRDEILPFVALKDPTFSIESSGFAAKVVRQINVVARKGSPPTLLQWKEP